ncbi:helix-turn-helix domain-containing protein [Egibacter rhizosphaerae]|nr:helix-turn-helix domain-containing protein [Egibacter rhizosphaerae]
MAVTLKAEEVGQTTELFEEILTSPEVRLVDAHGHEAVLSPHVAGFLRAAVVAASSGNALLFSEDDTMSPAEAAQVLGVSRPMVYRYIKDGLLEDRPVNTYHRIPAASVHELAEQRRGAAERSAQLLRDDPDHPRVAAARARARARRADRDA